MAIFLTILLITAIAVGLFVLSQRRRVTSRTHPAASLAPAEKADTASSITRLQEKGHFWGVELGQSGCAESDKLLGRQFTFDEAPLLPLDDCGSETCKCHFKGLRDRRLNSRRMQPDRRVEVRFDKTHPDRRRKSGRRRGELWAGHSL